MSSIVDKDDAKILFRGNPGEIWMVFEAKAMAMGRKKNWHKALGIDMTKAEKPDEIQMNEHAYCWLLGSAGGSAGKCVMMKQNDAFKAWQGLKRRYSAVVVGNLSALHKKLTAVINEGPGREDSAFYFHDVGCWCDEIVNPRDPHV